MRDVKPRRMEREAGPRKTSPGEPAPRAAAPDFAAPSAPAAPIVAVPPAVHAEPEPEIVSGSPQPQTDSREDPWTAFADAHSLFARGLEEIAAEFGGMSRSGIALAAEAAGALLGATTFSEAAEINAALARRETDVMIEGAAKLAEIGVKAIGELSQPILTLFGARWNGEPAHG